MDIEPRPTPQIAVETLLREEEVMAVLGLRCAVTLRRWEAEGRGPPRMKVGRVIRYPLTGLNQWLAERVHGRAA